MKKTLIAATLIILLICLAIAPVSEAVTFAVDGFRGAGDPNALLGDWTYVCYQIGAAVANVIR